MSPEKTEGHNSEGEGLHFLGFPLEMGVGNNAPTLNTADLAGLVFLLRDTIRDQATVRTGACTGHRWRLCGLLWFIELHVAPLGHE